MAKEYRIELGASLDREMALKMLAGSPYFLRPSNSFYDGEIWLTLNPEMDYSEARLFPRSFGYFLEITCSPPEILNVINKWVGEMRLLGACSIVDNDTGEDIQCL